MLQELRLFLTAVQFFTRLPIPSWVGHDAQQLGQTVRYFPAVGLLVGAFCAATYAAAAHLLPLSLATGLSIAAGILMTGAFHEDGLSDFADGLGGGYTREKALAIMKDSRIGAFGAIALIIALLLKYQSLLSLGDKHSLIYVSSAMIAAHSISRLMAASLMLTQRYIREDADARAKPAALQPGLASSVIALITGILPLLLLSVSGARLASLFAALACALLMRAYLARLLKKRLGGYTGDCLGATQQLTELAFYLGLLANL